jgi:hypothetical protein
MSTIFRRALAPNFIERLKDEASKAGWWADVLADPQLFIAPRGSYLDVYWRGQRLFHVRASPSGLKVTTHPKYLVDPALARPVTLADGSFNVPSGFIDRYSGQVTLNKMKSAAGLFSKLEKIGCHEITIRNRSVVDCEIAFPGKVSLGDGGGDKTTPRVDLAALEPNGDDARLVFWEAKHYSNGELRAERGRAPVCRQVDIYCKYLSLNREAVEESYTKVAANLVAISAMGAARSLSPLIREVGTGTRTLTLGTDPKVGLIIFGFDMGQRDHPIWQDHLQGLKANIPCIRAAGDAKVISLTSPIRPAVLRFSQSK